MQNTPEELQRRLKDATDREQALRGQSRSYHQAGDLDSADLLYVEALVWAVRAQDLREMLADQVPPTVADAMPSTLNQAPLHT